jgi:glycosyltransferase involved in cell wall biosynthesis
MLRCLEAGIPYVSICQANYEYWWPEDQRADVVRRAYRGCVKSFFVSDRNRRLFETQIGEPLASAEVVRNPFNVSYDASPPWPDASDTLRLACVGRLEPKAKGQDLIVEVLSREKWRRRPIHVSFFGSGPCLDNLRRLVAGHQLASTVAFGGHVPDVESIWKTHHALLLPSRYEGLPLALVEAMLCGRFGIVTDVAGNAEIVDDNVSGFVACMPTAAQLDEAMERAWVRREEWQRIGHVAADSIRRHVPRDPAAIFAKKLLALG